MSLRNILYIANLRLPTEKAYGIQIAKMCEAFAFATQYNANLPIRPVRQSLRVVSLSNPQAQGPEFIEGRMNANDANNTNERAGVELVVPYRQNEIKDDFFDYYSIKRNFKLKKTWALDFYFPGRLDRISVLFKDFISGTTLALYGLFSGADIIYSRDEWPLYFLSFFRKNLVYEAHRFSDRRTLFYERFKNKNFKIVIITKRLKEDFIKVGFKPENILVAPDGVDLDEFNINISREEARARVGLPPNVKIVIYAGHLFEWKGAAVLLETARNFEFRILNFEKKHNILFVFVGGTDYEIDKFKRKATGLNNVMILGQKPHKEIPTYLKAADIFILPNSGKEEISRSYTSPLKLFEYMASGRPIVASALPSIREILNGQNSVLVKPDNPESLAEGIKKLLNDPTFADRLAQKAFNEVKSYTWEKRSSNIIKFIN